MVNLNFILARSRSMIEVRLWSDCCFVLLFLLAELFLFITHKSIVSLVVLHLWLPFPLNGFRVQTFWCKCGVSYFSYYAMPGSWWSLGVIAFTMSGLLAMDLWNLSSLNMRTASFTMTRHKNIRPFPSHLILDEAVTLTFSCCEVSASRILQVPEPYSLIFFKNFSSCSFSENFSCLTVK